MTTEQLNRARATLWHQDGSALLTADDASAWLRETGVCLFLPRPQLAVPAPSFAEATLGASEATPAPAAIATAAELLHRLLASGDAIALNLFATPGEQPDLLATPETLPFLFALRGDREWKRGPRGRSSPLTIEIWKLLGKQGPLTASEIKDQLGRQLTEAAALRALTELWSHMRIEPVYRDGEPAAWQLLERRHQQPMQAGSNLSQAVAISALASLYLHAAVAASSEELETFLSPLASRSKVREVLKGLLATRQLTTLHLGTAELLHVTGSLPEFAEVARPEAAVVEDLSEAGPASSRSVLQAKLVRPAGPGEGRQRFVAKRLAASGADAASAGKPAKPAWGKRPANAPPARPRAASPRPASSRPASQDAGRGRSFPPRPGNQARPRKPYGTRGGTSFNPREPWNERSEAELPPRPRAEFKPGANAGTRAGTPGERRPFRPREGQAEQSSSGRAARPFRPREESGAKRRGDRKPFPPRKVDSGRKRETGPSDRRAGGDRRPFSAPPGQRRSGPDGRKESEARPYQRKPFGGGKPARFHAPGAERKSPGEGRKSLGAERKSWGPARKSFGDRKPFSPREAGPKPRPSPPGTRPFADRPAGRATTPAKGSSGGRPQGPPFAARGKFRGRPPAGRPGGARPSGGKPGFKRSGRPGKGRPD